MVKRECKASIYYFFKSLRKREPSEARKLQNFYEKI